MNIETTFKKIEKARGPSFRAFVKRSLKPYPALFIPVFRCFGADMAKELLISPKTDLIIEGFPRSANTFSVVAFQSAGNRFVNIAHHLHAEAQIIAGVRRGLPTMALLRDPEKAVRSLRMLLPAMDENRALVEWIAFYERIMPLKDRIFFAEFSQVTTDFGAVTAGLNEKFGTDFSCFDHTPENVAAVYSEIEGIDQRLRGGSDMHIARPSTVKSEAQSRTTFNFDPRVLAEARSLFSELAGSTV